MGDAADSTRRWVRSARGGGKKHLVVITDGIQYGSKDAAEVNNSEP